VRISPERYGFTRRANGEAKRTQGRQVSYACSAFVTRCIESHVAGLVAENGPDTVGELKSAEMWVSNMSSLKAKKLGKLAQEKVLLEL